MSQELHYTSVPRGLKPGARGFCTVAHTAGLSQAVTERLEGLSGYRPRFKPNDPNEALNPIVWSHLRLTGTGPVVTVVSRVGPAGLDYTGRENKHAHHVVLEPGERPTGGPAWLLSRPGFMQSSWPEAPRVLPAGPDVPRGDLAPTVCRAWESQAGDAGWAGVVAESFLADPKRSVIVIYDPGTEILPLFTEAIALLPPDRRWEATFSTYFTGLAPGLSCGWRGVLRDTPEERQARSNLDSLIIDLGRPSRVSQVGPLVTQARTGERPATVAPAPRPKSPESVIPSPPAAALTPPPVTDLSGHDDDSSVATPPPAPRQRSRRTSQTPNAGIGLSPGSLRAIVGAGIVGGVLFLGLVGAGLTLVLRNDSPKPTVKLALAEPKKDETTKDLSDGSKSKTPTKSEPAQNTPELTETKGEKSATPESKDSTPATNKPVEKPIEMKPDHKASPPGDAGDSTKAQAPNVGPESKKTNDGDKPPQTKEKPVENEPPVLGFFRIPFLTDPTGAGLPSIKTSRPVKSLSLIGGEDRDINPYIFTLSEDKTPPGRYAVREGKEKQRLLGAFAIKGPEVLFEWDSSTGSAEKELKKSLFDCVLDVVLDDNTHSYYWLRNPKIKPLSRPLKDLRKKTPPSKVEGWEFEVAWCGEVPGQHPDLDGTKRTFNLRRLLVKQDNGEVLKLKPGLEEKNKYFVALGAPGNLIVEPSRKSAGDLRFSLPHKPFTEEDIRIRLSNYLPPDTPGLTNDERKEIAKGADTAKKERLWTRTVEAALAGSVEAVISFKAGDQEFALPTLESGDRK